MVDLRFDIQPQRNDGHRAWESLVHLLHIVFIHAQVHLQLGEIHNLHQALAAAEPIALGHGDLVHGAVDARLEGFAIGQIQDFIPRLYRLVLGNIDVAHGGLTAVLQRFGMYGADLRIEAHGGKASSGKPSKKTTVVITGENPGESKVVKAQELGVPLMGEEALFAMLEHGPAGILPGYGDVPASGDSASNPASSASPTSQLSAAAASEGAGE